jgi:hypothetical protein
LLYPVALLLNPVAAYCIRVVCFGIREAGPLTLETD